MRKKVKLLHIITGLSTGGAEMALYKLLSASLALRASSHVISLTDNGAIGAKIQSLGVTVQALGMTRGVASPLALIRLTRIVRRLSPTVVQTWMYHADLIGGVVAKAAGVPGIAWGIRNSDLDPATSKRSTIWTARLCAKLSRQVPDRILCCSEASQRVHARLGYSPEKMLVIPNGFDLSAFKPDAGARRSVRAELRIPDDAPVIGLVARFDPQKDHRTFLRAAALVRESRPDAHFVLCGGGIDGSNVDLANWISEMGLASCCHLLGIRDDVPRVVAAFDVAASSSSYGEGFPNVLGEAMACAVPCVVTDVGDSASIVGDTGRVVPRRDPRLLASALMEFVSMTEAERRVVGEAARSRVRANFDLSDIAARYEATYAAMGLAGTAAPARPNHQ